MKRNSRLAAFAATVTALLACPAAASPTSTAEVGNSAHHLVHDATCQEVIDAFAAYGNPRPDQSLLLLNVINFQYGYAYAKGITPEEAFEEIATRCVEDPSQPFAGFPE